MKRIYYVLCSVDTEKFQGVSEEGYPYDIDHMASIRLWNTPQEAATYASHWPSKYELVEIEVVTRPIRTVTESRY